MCTDSALSLYTRYHAQHPFPMTNPYDNRRPSGLERTLNTTPDPVPLTEDEREEFFEQIDRLIAEDRYKEALNRLDELPDEEKDYRVMLTRALVRGLIGIFGEGGVSHSGLVDKAGVLDAVAILLAQKDAGKEDPLWLRRMAFAYHVIGYDGRALPYAIEWYVRAGQPEDAYAIIVESRHAVTAKAGEQLLHAFHHHPRRNKDLYYALTVAAAYEAILSKRTLDHNSRELALAEIDILKSVEEEGKENIEWNHVITYPLRFLGRPREALKYAMKWHELHPSDASESLIFAIEDDISRFDTLNSDLVVEGH